MSLIRTRLRLLSAVVVLILLAAACGSDADVASVEGGDTLTQDDVEELLDEVETDGDAPSVGDETLTGADVASLADEPGAGVIDRETAATAITDWVRNELWYSALAEAGFTDMQPYLDDARVQFEEFVATNPDAGLPAMESAAGQELIRSVALGPAIADYLLDVEGVEIEWPVQLCSSHILVETEEKAKRKAASAAKAPAKKPKTTAPPKNSTDNDDDVYDEEDRYFFCINIIHHM